MFPSATFALRLSQTNIISITFLPTPSEARSLSILHFNSDQIPELSSRELDFNERELSSFSSIHLHDMSLPAYSIAMGDNKPTLVPIPGSDSFSGSLLVLGRKDLYLFNISQPKGKARSHEIEPPSKHRESLQLREGGKAKQIKRRKAKASVTWPWGEIAA